MESNNDLQNSIIDIETIYLDKVSSLQQIVIENDEKFLNFMNTKFDSYVINKIHNYKEPLKNNGQFGIEICLNDLQIKGVEYEDYKYHYNIDVIQIIKDKMKIYNFVEYYRKPNKIYFKYLPKKSNECCIC